MAADRQKAWQLRQAVVRAIAAQERTVQAPVRTVETTHKVLRVSQRLLRELGREPSPEEIAAETQLPAEKVQEILETVREASLSEPAADRGMDIERALQEAEE